MQQHPNASYGVTLRIETGGVPGTLGRVCTAIGQTGGVIGAIDLVRSRGGTNVRDISIAARDRQHEVLIVIAFASRRSSTARSNSISAARSR